MNFKLSMVAKLYFNKHFDKLDVVSVSFSSTALHIIANNFF